LSGSSGLFGVKVALADFGFDQAVLCGIPMDTRPHFTDGDQWHQALRFRPRWQALSPALRDRIRSMSGWTREWFGAPGGKKTASPDSRSGEQPQRGKGPRRCARERDQTRSLLNSAQ